MDDKKILYAQFRNLKILYFAYTLAAHNEFKKFICVLTLETKHFKPFVHTLSRCFYFATVDQK